MNSFDTRITTELPGLLDINVAKEFAIIFHRNFIQRFPDSVLYINENLRSLLYY